MGKKNEIESRKRQKRQEKSKAAKSAQRRENRETEGGSDEGFFPPPETRATPPPAPKPAAKSTSTPQPAPKPTPRPETPAREIPGGATAGGLRIVGDVLSALAESPSQPEPEKPVESFHILQQRLF